MSKNIRPLIMLHTLVFIVSFTGIFGKAISLKEGVLIWYRLILSVFFLSIYIWFFIKTEPIRVQDRIKASGVGVLYGLHWLLWYASIKYANVSIAMSTISTVAVFNAIINPFISKGNRFKWSELVLALLASIGMFLIFQARSGYMTGALMGVLSAFIVAVASILNKSLTSQNDPYRLTLWEFASALAMLTCIMPIYLYFNPSAVLYPSKIEWVMLLVFVIVCTLLPFIMNLYVLRHVSSFTSNLAFNMEPVWGILAAILIFNEQKQLNLQFYIGLVLIMSSVIIYTVIQYYSNATIQNLLRNKKNISN